MKKGISTNAAPAAIGPYSQGIESTGRTAYVSGQLPIDSTTGKIAGEDIVSQTEQSIKNVEAILNATGMTLDEVVKTTVLLADINDFKAMNEVYAKHFKGTCPARAAFQVAALPMGAKVEIEAIAVKDC
ncbi:MAG: RidA family protein [Solobacterium sp.]|jgi:2-iminobutanoate/2-iminopropanoate deaminase|nr:RidA family protein [Solobacterium sp.]MCH4221947.1 RidA family protein [Solobacterium sp.]MCH4265552.1 RidA family protein [Solobacterium sp.]